MNGVKRAVIAGLAASALLATTLGLAPDTTYAKPIDETFAQRCHSISRRVAEIAHRYHYGHEFGLTDADRQAILNEYRDLVREWQAEGCDTSFGSLPRLAPRSKIDAANQTVTPGGQVVAPASQP